MADRTVSVTLNARVAGYIAQMQAAGRATAEVGAQGAGVAKDLGMLSPKLMGIGAAAGFMAVTAVKKFADFDAAMSGVKAATKETAAGMADLRDAAEEAGASTVYSATESADAITNLAKAGVSAADILSGGLDGALALAAAGSMDVADAAEIASAALVTFKLDGQDMTHVADLLAAGAGKAMGEVSDLGMALKMTGTVAAQTGLSIEETTAALSAMASRGLVGSDAGTSFKSFLQRLIPESEKAAAAMEDIGLKAYDAQGNFVGLKEVAGQLRTGLSKLTQEQQASALKTIFGSDAVRAAAIIYEEGAAGIEAWTGKVNDAGFAAETAATLTDNLKGDIERLTGALDTLFITAGEGGDGPLRDLVQMLTTAADAAGALDDGLRKQSGGAVAGLTGVLGGAFGMVANLQGNAERINAINAPKPTIAVTSPSAEWASDAPARAVRGLADALKEQEKAAKDAAMTMEDANNQYKAAVILALRASDAAINYEESLDDLTKTVKENGRTVDIDTEKGRENARAVNSMASAAAELIAQMREQGAGQEEVAAKADTMADALYTAARQAGYSKDEAEALADALRAVPDEVKTEYKTEGAGKAESDADRVADAANRVPRTITTHYRAIFDKATSPSAEAAYSGATRHDGGVVYGSGDVPITAKGGEYVVNAQQYAANRDLVRAINNGTGQVSGGGSSGPVIGSLNFYGQTDPAAVRANVIDAQAEAAYRGGQVR